MSVVINGSGSITGVPGRVVQIVSAANATAITYTAEVDVVSASITVTANSRVVIMASVPHYGNSTTFGWNSAFTIRLMQGGTQLLNCEHVGTITGEEQSHQVPVLFTTGSLSAGTYTFTVKCGVVTGGTHFINRDSRATTMTLMEIAG